MGADDSILSNLFLPFGKVRMGCPLGRLGWVIPLEKVRMGLRSEWVYPGE